MENERKPSLSFDIRTAKDLFVKLNEEYSDFKKDYLNARFAINSAITSWHLTDWTYQEYHYDDSRFQDTTRIVKKENVFVSGLLKYQQFLIKQCPDLEYMRLVTNGTKHCVLKDKSRTEKAKIHQGFFSSEFSKDFFDVSKFVIETQKGVDIDFEDALLRTIKF